MPDIPQRLAWPLRLNPVTGSLATVDQDSDDDIAQCIKALVLTRPGSRPDLPDMGVDDMTFGEQPVDLDQLRQALGRHEPRIGVLASTSPDALDAALADVNVSWDRVTPSADEEA